MFFERFRTDVRRYADGVHELGDAATPPAIAEAERRLERTFTGEWRELYRCFDGLRLFTDSFVIEPLERLAVEDGLVRLGEALGAPLFLDGQGRILERDEAGDRLVVGTTVERWLQAVMAREALVVDREGEFKDVFAGEDLQPEVQRKRLRVALKADPDASAWLFEAAELAFDDGDEAAAEAELRRAVERDAEAGPAWALLGALDRRGKRFAQAEASFRRAAAASRDRATQAERWAEAARAADEAGAEASRAGHAARAVEASRETVHGWLAEARLCLEEADADGALNLATLAHAVLRDEESAALVKQARVRRSLKPIT